MTEPGIKFVLGCVLGLVIGAGGFFLYQHVFAWWGWQRFSSPLGAGEYAFRFPQGYTVSNIGHDRQSDIVYIAEATDERKNVMTIEIVKSQNDARVTFSLPNGMHWEYFDEVAESFTFSNF